MAIDSRRDGDGLDRVIDDALESVLRGGRGDLRSHVLARLDEPVEGRRSPFLFLLRPASLPVAGAMLIIAGVAVSWWRVDGQLGRAGAGAARTSVSRTDQRRPAATIAAAASSPAPAVETLPAEAPARQERRALSSGDRVFASSWLAMDAASRPKGLADDSVFAGEEDSESFLPGATAGDLGDPIRPIPRLRPIVIAPIVAAPIADAPPVSTLATPAGTLPGDNSSRDRTGPGKPGGVRP
jgi:hypothetical protein